MEAASAAKSLIILEVKRRIFKDQLARFKDAIDAYRPDEDILKLKGKIKSMKEVFVIYTKAESKLLSLISVEDFKENLEEKLDIDEDYSDVIIISERLVDKTESQSVVPTRSVVTYTNLSGGNRHINLPPIALPTFNGRHENWPAFANRFKTSIHDNPTLNDCDRFNYLKLCLKDEPVSLISSIIIAASNYALTSSILEEYYNQSKLIVKKHLKATCDLPKLQKAS